MKNIPTLLFVFNNICLATALSRMCSMAFIATQPSLNCVFFFFRLDKGLLFLSPFTFDDTQTNRSIQHFHFQTYRKAVYGFMDDMDPQDIEKDDQGFSYKAMLARDRRRWSVADRDGDDNLTRDEFVEFLHPEESAHMRDIVVAETLEDIDKGLKWH